MKKKAVDRTLSVGLILLSFFIKDIASQSEIPREIVPAGSFSFNGKSYITVMKELSWGEASTHCNQLSSGSGNLVVINDIHIQALVNKTLSELPLLMYKFWIGLVRNNTNLEQFDWVDGRNMTFQQFYKKTHVNDQFENEPNNLEYRCVNILLDPYRHGYWNDDNCTERLFFMCELPAKPCIPGFTPLTSSDTCYSVVKENHTWEEAAYYCYDEHERVRIGSIESPEEQAYVEHLAANVSAAESSNIWIGLRKSKDSNNTYIWYDQSYAEYTNFYQQMSYYDRYGSEPNNVSHQCINMFNADSRKGYWNDDDCQSRFYFICEHPEIPFLDSSNSFEFVREGESVTFSCKLRSNNTDYSIVWYKWINETQSLEPVVSSQDLSSNITINSTGVNEKEFYLCSASVEMGTLYSHPFHLILGESGPPLNITVRTLNLTTMEVSWKPPTALHKVITAYRITYNNYQREVGGDVTMVTLGGLDCWTEYQVNVSAKTEAGFGKAVSAVGVTNVYNQKPRIQDVIVGSNSINLSFHLPCENPPVTIDYNVSYAALDHNCTGNQSNVTRWMSCNIHNPCILSGLVSYWDYIIRVQERILNTAGPWSDPLYERTLPAKPEPIRNLKMVNITSSSLIVCWDRPCLINSDAVWYNISIGNITRDVGSTNGDINESMCKELSPLMPYTNYNVTVTAGNREGLSTPVTIETTTKIADYLNVTVPVESYNVTYSQSVHLNCTVTAYPLHFLVQWEKLVNGEYNAITLDERHYGSSVAEPSLTINSVEWGDGGYYRCTATSSLGKRESRPIQVTVLVNYLNVTVPVESYNVTYSHSVHLNCTVTAYPLHFLVQWEKLVNGEYNAITLDERHYGSSVAEPSLTINSVEWGDGGYYRCTATSSLGKRESRPIQVTVLVVAPSIDVTVNNYINLTIRYWYDRPEFYNLTQRLMLHINGTRRDLPVSQQYYSLALLENTAYSLFIKSYTTYGVGTSSVKIVKTSVIPVYSKFMVAFKMTGFAYNISLFDSESDYYKNTFSQVINNVDSSMGEIKGYASSNVAMFRPGSVIVDLVVTKNQSGSNQDISGEFEQHVRSGSVGQLVVDPSYYKFSTGDGELRITQLMIYSPPELLEDAPATFICLVETFGQTGTIMANWKFNNVIISSTQISRWSQRSESVNPMLPQYRQFYLENSGLKLQDKGNISCEVYNERMSLQDERTLNIRVIPKPVVEIFPLTAIVRLGGNLTIECNVSSVDSEATIDWYKNGSPIVATSDQDTEVVIGNRGLTQVLQAKNIQRNTFFSCVGRNIAGEKSVQCNVTVIKEEDLHRVCNRSMDSYGTLWEEAVDSKLVIKPCTGNRTGNVSRLCVNGVWEEPDYSKCFRKDLLDLQEQAENLRDGASADDVNNILINLNDSSSVERGKLTSGDLSTASAALENVAEKTANQPGTFTNNNLDAFLSTTNNLLEPDNNEGWQQLKYKETDKMGKLLKALTTYSVTYTTTKDDKFNKFEVEKDNLVAEVGKVQNKDIVFPDRTKMKNEWIQNSQTVLNLPWESIDQNQKVGYVGVYCKNISDKFLPYLIEDGQVKKMDKNEDVNSDIIAFSIVPAKSNLNPPLNITFQHLNMDLTKPRCVFWDDMKVSSGAWSTVGGRLVNNTQNVSVCEFDHTTNFAILMSPMSGSTGHEKTLEYISMVGIGVSLVFLIITVLVYIVFWKHLKSARAKFLIMLCVMLIISYTVFLSGVKGAVDNKTGCTAVAVLLHYLLLVDFFLMLSVAIEIAFQILYVIPTGRSRTKGLFFFSFFGPAVIVGASVGATKFKGYGNSDGKSTSSSYCWLAADSGLIWAFIGPALLIALINLVITVLVFRAMFLSMTNEKGSKKSSKKDIAKSGARSICVLAPLFGLAWVFGVVSFSQDLVTFQYLFAIFNSLQGLFLFLFHCLLDRKVREFFLKRRKERTSAIKYSSNETPKKTKVTSGSDMNNNDLEKEKE